MHMFAGHVNTQHAKGGPHLGAQPLTLCVQNESSHAAEWLIQRDRTPGWGAWVQDQAKAGKMLCHNFNMLALQPIPGRGCLRLPRCDCQLWRYSFSSSAALRLPPRPIGFSMFLIANFLASDSPNHPTNPIHGLRVGGSEVLPTGATTVSTLGGWLPDPHWGLLPMEYES